MKIGKVLYPVSLIKKSDYMKIDSKWKSALLFLHLLGWSVFPYAQSLVVNGDAVATEGPCYLLTSDSSGMQVGSIFSTGTYSLNVPFSLKARLNFGCNEGAEGMAFIFATGNHFVGEDGEGLGYGGLGPSLVVEFDVRQQATSNDPPSDHIAIMANGVSNHASGENLAGPLPLPELEDCQEHCLQINWNPSTKTLTVTLDSTTLTYSDHIVQTIFGGQHMVYFGFTASSHNPAVDQRVCFGAPPIQEMEDIERCPGDSVVLQPDPNGLAYSWFPSPWLSDLDSPNPVASPLVTTVFFVTITFECGFQADDAVVYSVLPEPGIGIGSNSPVCEGGTLKLFAGGGDGFSWSGPNGFSSNLKDPVIQPVTPAHAGLYTVTVTGANLCVGVHEVLVEVGDTVLTSETIKICGNETADIFGTPTNVAGTYHKAFPRANGCDSTHVIHLEVEPVKETFDTLFLCETETVEIFGTPTNTPGDYQQTFTSSAGCDSTHHVHLIVGDTVLVRQTIRLCAGDSALVFGEYVHSPGEYIHLGTNQAGCDSTVVVEVLVNESLVLDLSAQQPCPGTDGGALHAMVSGGKPPYHYAWSVSSENGPTLEGLPAGDYSLTVTDQWGCSAEASALLSEVDPIDFELEVFDARCHGESSGAIELFPVSDDLRFSLDGGPFVSTTFFEGLAAGEWELTALDAYGCTRDTVVTVGQPQAIVLDLPASYDIERGDTVRLEPFFIDPTLSFSWSPIESLSCWDCPDPLAFPLDTMHYVLTATDSTGCSTSDTVVVNVELILDVLVPNAFTPNGDGINDRFYLLGKGIATYDLRIFNRWGAKVYDAKGLPANDASQGWDATIDGQPAPSEVYIYHAVVHFVNGTTKSYKGEVTVAR